MAKRSKPVPTADHAARFCHPTHLDNGVITPATFIPRPRDDKRLSTVWVECANKGSAAEQEKAVQTICCDYIPEYHEEGKVTAMNVGKICSIEHGDHMLTVIYRTPSGKSRGMPCHARIGTLTHDEDVLDAAKALADLANESWVFSAS